MMTGLVLVQEGDTLSAIAQAVMGDAKYADAIAAINGIPDPNLILPGMLLQMPSRTGNGPAPVPRPAETHLGKIANVRFGPDLDVPGAPLTLFLDLEFGGLATSDRVDDMSRIRLLMGAARVNDIGQLKGRPIQVTRLGNSMVGWRILTEVL